MEVRISKSLLGPWQTSGLILVLKVLRLVMWAARLELRVHGPLFTTEMVSNTFTCYKNTDSGNSLWKATRSGKTFPKSLPAALTNFLVSQTLLVLENRLGPKFLSWLWILYPFPSRSVTKTKTKLHFLFISYKHDSIHDQEFKEFWRKILPVWYINSRTYCKWGWPRKCVYHATYSSLLSCIFKSARAAA
jgi:hypothetical protein